MFPYTVVALIRIVRVTHPFSSMLAPMKLMLLTVVILLTGCGDPYYNEYITDIHFNPKVGKYCVVEEGWNLKLDSIPVIEVTEQQIIVTNLPVINFHGDVVKVIPEAKFPCGTMSVGSRSDGKTTYGYQDKSSEVVLQYLTNNRISILIGDPDEGKRILFALQ